MLEFLPLFENNNPERSERFWSHNAIFLCEFSITFTITMPPHFFYALGSGYLMYRIVTLFIRNSHKVSYSADCLRVGNEEENSHPLRTLLPQVRCYFYGATNTRQQFVQFPADNTVNTSVQGHTMCHYVLITSHWSRHSKQNNSALLHRYYCENRAFPLWFPRESDVFSSTIGKIITCSWVSFLSAVGSSAPILFHFLFHRFYFIYKVRICVC